MSPTILGRRWSGAPWSTRASPAAGRARWRRTGARRGGLGRLMMAIDARTCACQRPHAVAWHASCPPCSRRPPARPLPHARGCPLPRPARLLFCGTLLGKVSIVRQLEPELHIDGHPQTVRCRPPAAIRAARCCVFSPARCGGRVGGVAPALLPSCCSIHHHLGMFSGMLPPLPYPLPGVGPAALCEAAGAGGATTAGSAGGGGAQRQCGAGGAKCAARALASGSNGPAALTCCCNLKRAQGMEHKHGCAPFSSSR